MSATDKRKEAMVGQMPRELWSSIVHMSIATSCKYTKNKIKFLQIKKKVLPLQPLSDYLKTPQEAKAFRPWI